MNRANSQHSAASTFQGKGRTPKLFDLSVASMMSALPLRLATLAIPSLQNEKSSPALLSELVEFVLLWVDLISTCYHLHDDITIIFYFRVDKADIRPK